MPFDFRLPDLGEGIREAEILSVKINEGQVIAEDAPLFEVETDKAVVEIPSPVAGKVTKVYVIAGQNVPVGTVMVSIENSGSERSANAISGQVQANVDSDSRQTETVPGIKPGQSDRIVAGEIIATPATRQLARELKIDIHLVHGTGAGGRISKDDLLAYAENKKENKVVKTNSSDMGSYSLPDFEKYGAVERMPMRSIRRKTAQLMSLSWAKIPHVTHCDEANITELENLRGKHEKAVQAKGGRLTLTAFLVKAVTSALQKFPQFNASFDESKEEIILKHYYNIGLAVATERGLIVPVVREVDKKNISELAIEINNLVEKTRNGKVELEELQGGTFTITNIGAIGGTSATPIISYPESAILAVMQAKKRAIVTNGKLDIGLIMPLSLAFDHRITDGAEAANFVKLIVNMLEEPADATRQIW